MARTSEKLSALKVERLAAAGYHNDGLGLYLRVAPGGAKGWIFRFTHSGRVRDMGLGAYPAISLADARKLAHDAHLLVKEGRDPIEDRKAKRAANRVASAKTLSFDEAARRYIEDQEAGWRNAKHRAQWTSTLATYASPVFGKLPVSEIDSGLVLRALKPIWNSKTETASRLRGRIESVLDWAAAHGYRSGDSNPARWKGHLQHSLPKKSKVAPVEHHAALPFAEIGTFVATLRERDDAAARALQFIVLTAVRSGEALGATWDEIDLDAKMWTVPAARMKAGKEHRVPLSAAALALLTKLHATRVNDFVFPGAKSGRPLSDMAVLMLLRRMGRRDVTVHGFRSTFRDWAAELTAFPNHVVEMALAHAVSNAVEAAYRRGDLFDKRRRLMDEWAKYCSSPPAGAKVVPIRSA